MQMLRVGVRDEQVRSVDFVCPRCGLDRAGAEVRRRRHVVAFGIALVELPELERTVRCDECGHRCDLGALEIPTTDQLAGMLERATVAAMVLAVRSTDGGDDVRHRAIDALRAAGYAVDTTTITEADGHLTDADAFERLRSLRSDLTAYGKQGFLHRVTSVAMGGAELRARQRTALVGIGRSLGMATANVNGILAVASVHADT